MNVMLTGHALLERVNAQARVTDALIARCGYVTQRRGRQVLCRTGFYKALLAAKGLPMEGGATVEARRGRGGQKRYRTRVHFNGNLMVLGCYVKQLGYRPGDRFVIKLGDGEVALVPLSAGEDELQRRLKRRAGLEGEQVAVAA